MSNDDKTMTGATEPEFFEEAELPEWAETYGRPFFTFSNSAPTAGVTLTIGDVKRALGVREVGRVPVHADGGSCHGTKLVTGRCPKCGIVPDAQSVELWEPQDALDEQLKRAYERGVADGQDRPKPGEGIHDWTERQLSFALKRGLPLIEAYRETVSTLGRDLREAHDRAFQEGRRAALAEFTAEEKLREDVARIVGCERSDMDLWSERLPTSRETRMLLRARTADGAVHVEGKLVTDRLLVEADDAAKVARFVYLDLAERIAKRRKAVTLSAGTYYIGDVVEQVAAGLVHVREDIGAAPGSYDEPHRAAAETFARGAAEAGRATKGVKERASAEWSRQVREKLAKSEVMHGVRVYCQTEED